MIIQGLQKLTLLDYPEKVACTVFTGGCNFRCPFCHNAPLVTHLDCENKIDEETVLSFLKKRQGILDGVCVTGGEPLLQPDIDSFISKIKALGFAVKLDTNGSFPDRLSELIDGGLVDYVAMDIKNSLQKYAATTDKADLDLSAIEKSIAILKADKIPYEFRTTVVQELHTVKDFEEIGKLLLGCKKYFIQAFVDSGDLICEGLHAASPEKMAEMLAAVRKYLPFAELRGI